MDKDLKIVVPTQRITKQSFGNVFEHKVLTKEKGIKGWILRKCYEILRKNNIFKPYHEDLYSIELQEVYLTSSMIEEAIMRSDYAMQQCYNTRPRMIIIGRDQFMTLSHINPISSRLDVTLNGFSYRGVEVCYIPWFDGIVVVPENRG